MPNIFERMIEMKAQTLLEDELARGIETLGEMEVGTEDYNSAVDGLTKLADRAIEMEKLKSDTSEKLEKRLDDKKDRFVQNCLAAAGIIIPTVVTVWGTIKTLRFEQDGTVTTIMGRGFINKLIPKK